MLVFVEMKSVSTLTPDFAWDSKRKVFSQLKITKTSFISSPHRACYAWFRWPFDVPQKYLHKL